jgi:hypothetical protein
MANDRNSASTHFGRGSTLYAQKNYTEAIKEFKQAIAL